MSGVDEHGPEGEAAAMAQPSPDAVPETSAEVAPAPPGAPAPDAAAAADAAAEAARAESEARAAADAAAEAAAAVRAAGAAGEDAAAPAVAIPARLLETPEIPGVSDALLGDLHGSVAAAFPQRRRRRQEAIEAAIEAAAPVGDAHPGQLSDAETPPVLAPVPADSAQSGYGGLAVLIFGGLGVILVGAVLFVAWLASNLG